MFAKVIFLNTFVRTVGWQLYAFGAPIRHWLRSVKAKDLYFFYFAENVQSQSVKVEF